MDFASGIFGSVARGEQQEGGSDVDVYVELPLLICSV